MGIQYRTTKFKSANILAIEILGSTAKFNSRQHFRLYDSMKLQLMAKYKVQNTLFLLIFSPYLYAVLVHRLNKIENLVTFPQQSLYEG